ncbi:Xaa-Pro aminopeptidase 2 [Aix galericulata]|nr:Xaa-Pro aminopeptidase 2 [Aix galericulata]
MSPWRGWVGPGTRSRAPHPAPARCASVFCPCFACLVGVKHGGAFPWGALLLLQPPGHVPGSQTGPSIPGMLSTGQAPASASAVPCGHPAVPIVAIPLCPGVPVHSAHAPRGAPRRAPTQKKKTPPPPKCHHHQYLPPTATNTTARLAALRDAMRAHSVHAYIVPSTDAHMVRGRPPRAPGCGMPPPGHFSRPHPPLQSEYIAERDSRLGWLTGFTGSAGTVVVTLDRAALWTDSRYWTQAERQLDCNWELQRTSQGGQGEGGLGGSPFAILHHPLSFAAWIKSIGQWILEWVPAGGNVSLDPFLFSIDTWNSYSQALQGSGRALVPLETNLVDQVWGDQRPPPASSEIYSLPAEFTGSSWQEKVTGIRQQMEEHTRSPTALLLSGLEETAWLFNLRGDDIPYNPVFYSYTLLTSTNISLFVDEGRLTVEARQSLRAGCPGPLCVELHNYSQARAHLQRYAQGNVTVWLGTEYTTYGLYGVIPQEKLLEDSYSPVMLAKAVKNSKEQELLRAAHVRAVPTSSPTGRRVLGRVLMPTGRAQVRDAVAVIQYLLWLEQTVPQGQVDEFLGARHIDALRWSVPPHPGRGGAAQGARDPPSHLSLSPLAAFQGPAAQPRAQLRVHLRQRAQRGARPLQVWGRGLGMWSWRGSRVPAPPPFSSPAHPTPPEGSCRWMRCTWRTPAGSTCAYPTPYPPVPPCP